MNLPLEVDVLRKESVQELALTLGLSLPHAQQWHYLQSLETQDIQAAPGCGKTTLTAAKLCLLSGGWRSSTRGICVLSHTNVAKDEILRIVGRHTDGRALLGYPHFVGTIQSFVDAFLAMPRLRGRGVELRAIDDEVYARVALKRLDSWQAYSSLKGIATRRQDISGKVASASYVWDQNKLKVRFLDELPYPGKPSAKQFEALKHRMFADGYLRYEDMYALAREQVFGTSGLIKAIRYRFPLVIIDEAQDTSSDQDDLINTLFQSDDVVLQRIGDVNQAIFGDDSEPASAGSFPCPEAISLPQTMRFGPTIADGASKLTFERSQDIEGNSDRPCFPLAVILFDTNSVSRVLETFGELVCSTLTEQAIEGFSIKAVGARKKSSSQAFPSTLQSYVPLFEPTSTRSRLSKLADACARARSAALTGINPAQHLWDGLTELLTLGAVKLLDRRPSRRSVVSALSDQGIADLIAIKRLLYELAFPIVTDEFGWKTRLKALITALPWSIATSPDVQDFCSFQAPAVEPEQAEAAGVLRVDYKADGRELNIDLSTIHGSKGETHAATLILECCSNKIFDLKEVIPILLGNHDPKRLQKTKGVQEAVKLAFVGMTRARSLVVFAVLKDHVTDVLDELHMGWTVIDLCQPS